MTSYRPITDTWILARSKVKYYGAYPAGFLQRARDLLGVTSEDAVLHVCSGRVRDYPFKGLGRNDITLDIDRALKPDIVHDVASDGVPCRHGPGCSGARDCGWPVILTDPPYSVEDANHYCGGNGGLVYPEPTKLLRSCLEAVVIGGRVGMLHYVWPRPPKWARSVAVVTVLVGFANRARLYSVFERVA